MPRWAVEFNNSGILSNYLRSVWMPMNLLSTYSYSPCNQHNSKFYIPDDNSTNSELIKRFRFTTYANTIVSTLAQKAITQEGLGKGTSTDVLCLNFNVNTFDNNTSELNCAEKEDLYLSLDRDIDILLKKIPDIEHTLVVIAGTQAEPLSQASLTNNNLNVGKFDGKRVMALLNSYIMAKYGQARWILNYSNGNIYLNDKEIERQNVDYKSVLQDVVSFISNVKGVSLVNSYDNIKQAIGDPTELTVRLRNSTFSKRNGDIILTLNAGWQDISIDGQTSVISTVALQQTPVVFYGLNIDKSNIYDKYFITDIANTICKIVQVPPPSSSVGNYIFIKTKQK